MAKNEVAPSTAARLEIERRARELLRDDPRVRTFEEGVALATELEPDLYARYAGKKTSQHLRRELVSEGLLEVAKAIDSNDIRNGLDVAGRLYPELIAEWHRPTR